MKCSDRHVLSGRVRSAFPSDSWAVVSLFYSLFIHLSVLVFSRGLFLVVISTCHSLLVVFYDFANYWLDCSCVHASVRESRTNIVSKIS